MRKRLLALGALLALSTIHCSTAEAESPPACFAGQAADCAPRPPAAVSPTIEVVNDNGSALPTFRAVREGGRVYVLGEEGDRYRIRLSNPTPARVEAVVSIDGLDAVDGKPANFAKRGYIIPAYGEMTMDGWRTSLDEVAAFRFGAVHDSYAARTGSARNVGVIGVAFFRERIAPAAPPPPSIAAEPPAPGAGAGAAAAAAPPVRAARPSATPSPVDRNDSAVQEDRVGLGTEFGEAHVSHVSEVAFRRASARPFAVFEMRYDDEQALVSRGILPPSRDEEAQRIENERRDSARAFPAPRFAEAPPHK